MPRILILADDLSGAADTAIACANSGARAVVTLGEIANDFAEGVLAIDCDTRHLKGDTAAARVEEAFRHYANIPDLTVYKKLDSTLRGNVAAELAAILRVRRRGSSSDQRVIAVMAPAFPARGRTTVNGQILLNGVPLNQSEIWERSQEELAWIPSLFSESGLQAATLDLLVIRSGDELLTRAMLSLAAAADVIVCDAETEEDLAAIARAAQQLGALTVWAGSAGLAHHLPRPNAVINSSSSRSQAISQKPTLFVVGSKSSISQEQARTLEQSTGVYALLMPPEALLSGQWSQKAKDIETALEAGSDVLVVVDTNDQRGPEEGRKISAALGTMLCPMVEQVGSLFASGGETARAVLDAWQIRSLDMMGEVESGLPFALATVHGRKMAVLTKAGAFGDSQTLIRCREFIRSLTRTAPIDDPKRN